MHYHVYVYTNLCDIILVDDDIVMLLS